MKVRFWGVRGGVPTPGAGHARFGGNTSCISVESDSGELLILDAGTGLRLLGNQLLQRAPQGGLEATILFSHLHWDHIQGIPFFKPLFNPRNTFRFMGQDTKDLTFQRSLEVQQASSFFPVDLEYMSARKSFHSLTEGTFQQGPFSIQARRLNHPGGCLGFRIQVGEACLVYATDTEHIVEGPDPVIVDLARHADLLIFDTNYTPEEYRQGRVGWGHSTWEHAILNARAAGVRRLVMFHHDQDHDDVAMDAIERAAHQHCGNCFAAREGMVLQLQERKDAEGARELEILLPEGGRLSHNLSAVSAS
ncbi:MAG: MBL fold metallo-hydrolase [Calditrichaeota bacterium]|nr:MBL fold metallo-hydrolase [Calditrichota bacterium]MCB9474022.1 MBL fold metallo-hydrolase [Candidatus Delongbacteria bacterium]